MPFGIKTDPGGRLINFDAVYAKLIKPAIEGAGMEPLRADEEMTGGIIHKPMFERLVLCEYAVTDLTTANANVFYELGVRHATRSWSTVLIFAEDLSQLPFDVAPLRAIPYCIDTTGIPINVEATSKKIALKLKNAIKNQDGEKDSPLYQLLEDFPDIDHTKTDVFREMVEYSVKMRERLAEAKKLGIEALKEIEEELGDLTTIEAGVVIDLYLSYRAVEAWPEMIALVDKMSPPIARTVMVQEQLGLALNRNKEHNKAKKVLLGLIKSRGPSSETYGILGRVYKDLWEKALESGSVLEADGFLEKSIEAYLSGFEADWRDAYPGINTLTLMEVKEPPDERRLAIMPVVRYAVERKIASKEPDYWDHATMLELSVLSNDRKAAMTSLSAALTLIREIWEPKTTLKNMCLILEARKKRDDDFTLVEEVVVNLEKYV